MALLQPKLSLKVAQRQILTPGLMQMVSVLALNKLELKEMINAEITENPILEEIEENVPLLDEVAAQEIEHDRAVELRATENEPEKKTDPFEEIDFGSYFQDYLDPGFRTPNSFEITEAPSLENYLSSPGTLTDHIFWQLGSLNLLPAIRDAAEYIIGNLNEDGYLRATDEELLDGYLREQLSTDSSDVNGHHAIADLPPAMLERARAHLAAGLAIVRQLDPVGIGTRDLRECLLVQVEAHRKEFDLIFKKQLDQQQQNGSEHADRSGHSENVHGGSGHRAEEISGIALDPDLAGIDLAAATDALAAIHANGHVSNGNGYVSNGYAGNGHSGNGHHGPAEISSDAPPIVPAGDLHAASETPSGVEPNGHGAGFQPTGFQATGFQTTAFQTTGFQPSEPQPSGPLSIDPRIELFETATKIIDKHLQLLQKRDPRELSKAVGRSMEAVQQAIDFIRTLDPRPGQRFNRSDARLIEPDVAFVKRGDEYVVVMNEEDLPNLRLNQGYRRMLTQEGAEKEVKDYVKERYRSALQLMRNIEQRKNTILRTCEAIVRRQQDFLEKGVEALRPMMIKEVAEEIGVHPSTVSRAVSNKYVHTSQGVYELRFFFSEGVNGPEGSGTPLMLLKRKVKKLIEEEDPRKPLTDDHIAAMLQSQGIDVTRRTVAKYREDLRIPSTHQRRVRG
jgi:DNA-directed RNA polymerase specialized sigma54-like protein